MVRLLKVWDLPKSIGRLYKRLQRSFTDWDRQFVGILNALPLYGLDAVEQACEDALAMRAVSKDVVPNLLHRNLDRGSTPLTAAPSHLTQGGHDTTLLSQN